MCDRGIGAIVLSPLSHSHVCALHFIYAFCLLPASVSSSFANFLLFASQFFLFFSPTFSLHSPFHYAVYNTLLFSHSHSLVFSCFFLSLSCLHIFSCHVIFVLSVSFFFLFPLCFPLSCSCFLSLAVEYMYQNRIR